MNKEEAIYKLENMEEYILDNIERPNPYVIDKARELIFVIHNNYEELNYEFSFMDGRIEFSFINDKTISFYNDGKINYKDNEDVFVSEDFSYLKQFFE